MGRFILFLMLLAAPLNMAAADAQRGGVDDPRAFVMARFEAYARSPVAPPPLPSSVYDSRLRDKFADYRRWTRRAARRLPGWVAPLNFDWWVNAQDWRITDIQVTERFSWPRSRIVTASWRNHDRADTSMFHFIHSRNRWYLFDVSNGPAGERRWSLSSLLDRRF
jgi:hypothetical protein